eukprot:Rhum_TRINITY_DN15608_c0_g1::Rhum_TRINITY_DN15608_c0_g1_i1::g.161634::m.161634
MHRIIGQSDNRTRWNSTSSCGQHLRSRCIAETLLNLGEGEEWGRDGGCNGLLVCKHRTHEWADAVLALNVRLRHCGELYDIVDGGGVGTIAVGQGVEHRQSGEGGVLPEFGHQHAVCLFERLRDDGSRNRDREVLQRTQEHEPICTRDVGGQQVVRRSDLKANGSLQPSMRNHLAGRVVVHCPVVAKVNRTHLATPFGQDPGQRAFANKVRAEAAVNHRGRVADLLAAPHDDVDAAFRCLLQQHCWKVDSSGTCGTASDTDNLPSMPMLLEQPNLAEQQTPTGALKSHFTQQSEWSGTDPMKYRYCSFY